MTRNTKLYKSQIGDSTIVYRTLTALEISILNNITNPVKRSEMAAKMAVVEGNIEDVHYSALQQIGDQAITNSMLVFSDNELFEMTVKEFRGSVSNDPVMNMIKSIISVLPSTSIEYLLNLNYKDLIELLCLCETLTNKKMFNIEGDAGPVVRTGNPGQKVATGHGVATVGNDGKLEFADDGKSLAEKIKENQKFYGQNND